jgi:hypothetical protein
MASFEAESPQAPQFPKQKRLGAAFHSLRKTNHSLVGVCPLVKS